MLSALMAAAAPVWNAAASLDTTRTNHTATLLPNGKVLVAGGGSRLESPSESPLASAELYDPATNSWSAAGAMATGRWLHTATLLSNGKVLVVGGADHGTVDSPIGSAELYDPATNSWSAAGALATARNWHTATLLANGKVLVAGGYGGKDKYPVNAELYDPLTNSWSAAGTLPRAFSGHTATLLLNGKVLVAVGDWAQLYDPASNSWSAARAMTNWRVWHTATLLPNGKVLVAAGHDGRWDDYASAELYDPATDTWSAAAALSAARYKHTATLLANGKVLIAGGDYLANAELYDPASNSWSIVGALTVARESHTATLLLNGKVLVTGGYNYFYLGRVLASAELYDPAATDSWRAAGPLTAPRDWHTATLLPNGSVLVAGGYNAGSLASTERYNPATNSWRTAGTMSAPRSSHTATLLANGKVLVAGGYNYSAHSSTELYDPATDSWSTAGTMSAARYAHTATLLPNGKVLVVGGLGDNATLASAELYDPATNSWSPAGALSTVRFSHAATLLPNGKVLVEGGRTGVIDGSPLASAELYDPATNRWSPAGTLTTARSGHTATLLANGTVLVAGGILLTSAELYDPVTDSWSPAGTLTTARSGHTATLLADGKVLVAGGSHRNALSSAEQYDPASNSWSAAGAMTAARNVHTMTLLPSGKVLVAGGAENSPLANVDLYDPTFYLPLPCTPTASPSAISGSAGSQAGCNTVMEFYNTTLDHYFLTADAGEAAAIDNGSAGPGWNRTGINFNAGGTTPVCRFYGSQSPGPNSHFYTVTAEECATLKQLQTSTPATQKRWNFESLDFLSTVPLAAATGYQFNCPSGLTPVYRAYNNGFARGVDSNHRLSTSLTAIQQAVARGWINEGVVMCAPL